MATADNLRNSIIDKLLTITNKEYLLALYQLVEKSSGEQDTDKLIQEQVLMLELSDEDIKNLDDYLPKKLLNFGIKVY